MAMPRFTYRYVEKCYYISCRRSIENIIQDSVIADRDLVMTCRFLARCEIDQGRFCSFVSQRVLLGNSDCLFFSRTYLFGYSGAFWLERNEILCCFSFCSYLCNTSGSLLIWKKHPLCFFDGIYSNVSQKSVDVLPNSQSSSIHWWIFHLCFVSF